MRDVSSIEYPDHGVQSHPGLVRKQHRFEQHPQQIMGFGDDGNALDALTIHRPGERLHQGVKEQLDDDHNGGDPPGPRGDQP